jgi:hypothetical protein
MGWRFRKSFRVIPGVRLSVSTRGVSATIGGGPVSFNVGPSGAYANVHLPGTGLSYRERLSDGAPAADTHEVVVPESGPPPTAPAAFSRVEIESASTYELTTEALAQFQQLLANASREQEELDGELATAEPEALRKTDRFQRWSDGAILRRLMKRKFQEIAAESEDASAKVAELQEQRRLAFIATQIEVADSLRRPFGRLCDSFARLCDCQKIWDTLAIQKTDRFRERTTAEHSIERRLVRFELGASDLLTCEWNVPKLANANGGDLYLYPGFLLYRVSRRSFAVIDAHEVRLTVSASRFIEEEGVPGDSEVVGEAWKRANKDGSPDRRFADNYRIPIAKYGELAFTTPAGLNEVYLISNYAAAEGFARAWQAYASAFETRD